MKVEAETKDLPDYSGEFDPQLKLQDCSKDERNKSPSFKLGVTTPSPSARGKMWRF